VSRFFSLPRPVLFVLAAALTLASALYALVWVHYVRLLPQAPIGAAFSAHAVTEGRLRITWVKPGGAAGQAGLRAGDSIVELCGQAMTSTQPWIECVLSGKPGSRPVFVAERPSGERFSGSIALPDAPPVLAHPTRSQSVLLRSMLAYPFFFLVVGVVVLFLRPNDPHAWLLALLFYGFVSLAPWVTPENEMLVPLETRRFATSFQFLYWVFFPALFYCFFAVFPAPSGLERRVPWLKWVFLGLSAAAGVPLAATIAATGSMYKAAELSVLAWGRSVPYVLGVVSLAWNFLGAPSVEVRRKTRVLLAGTLIGVVPMIGFGFVTLATGRQASPFTLPFWAWAGTTLCLICIPLSFAYAVVVHRVMELPVLFKRSARYFLISRGFILFRLIASAIAAYIAADFFSGFFEGLGMERGQQMVAAAGTAAAVVGGLMALTGARVARHFQRHLDKVFFRSAYDAGLILEGLAAHIRTARSCAELAALLDREIREALHPVSLTIYTASAPGRLRAESGAPPAELGEFDTSAALLIELAARAKPWDVPPATDPAFAPFAILAELQPECLVPMPARDGSLAGLMVLGPRLSEESYSGEDKRMLASVASQCGLAIESIRLAESMALRLEAEQRAAHELEMAQQVQARLLPQRAPRLATLEYAGRCVQAREVGGDYYDFLELGEGRMAFVLADVSGKGMPAALLMAGVQATLRTCYMAGQRDLAGMMKQVNRQLLDSTAAERFATLFLADYTDATRVLRYVNCGHNPPVIVRRDGSVQHLAATATVLGLFAQWECEVGEISIESGDVLAIYTDGAIEAAGEDGDEFGEDRLIGELMGNRGRPAQEVMESVASAALRFGGPNQADDLTLIVVRAV